MANSFAASVTRIDPRSGRTRTISVPRQPLSLAFGAGSLWVVDASGYVSRVDPVRNRVARRYTVGLEPEGIAVGGGRVYVTNGGDDTISSIDIRTGRVSSVASSSQPASIAYGFGWVWVTSYLTGGVARLRPAS